MARSSGANGAAELFREAGAVIDDPEDAAGFARALDALSEPQLRRPLAEAARALAEAHGWDAHLAALRALFERVRPWASRSAGWLANRSKISRKRQVKDP